MSQIRGAHFHKFAPGLLRMAVPALLRFSILGEVIIVNKQLDTIWKFFLIQHAPFPKGTKEITRIN